MGLLNLNQKRNSLSIILFITIAIAALAGLYFYKNGYKNYSSQKFGYSLEYPIGFSIKENNSDCIHVAKDEVRISIGLKDSAGCFPSGVGIIDKQEVLDSYKIKIGDRIYSVRDIRLVVGSDDDVWGAVAQDRVYWTTIKSPKNESISIYFNMPYVAYQDNIATVRQIISSIRFAK